MNDHELMKLAKRRVYSRKAFCVHLTVCAAITVMLVIIYFVTSYGEYFWPLWPMIGLGMGIVVHAIVFSSIFNSEDKVKAEYDRLKQMYNVEKL